MSGQKSILVLACALVWIGGAGPDWPQTIYYVNGTCGDDSWYGTSPVCQAPDGPVLTIQKGIDLARRGDIVIVADAEYVLSADINLGKEVTVRSANGSGSCTIDCNGNRGFLVKNNVRNSAVIEGFTILNGSGDQGGAIKCGSWPTSASPTIRGNVLRNNHATAGGGAIYCTRDSDPLIEGNTIQQNTSDTDGGGIYCTRDSDPLIEGNMIQHNSAEGFGGGIYVESLASPEIVDNEVYANTALDGGGGGIYWETSAAPQIRDCNIHSNRAEGSFGYGGGLFLSTSDLIITNCEITENYATGEGGGIFIGSGSPTITRCRINDNWVDYAGGGIATIGYCGSVGQSLRNQG